MGDRLTITLDNKKVLKHLKAHPKITSLGLVAGINKTTQGRLQKSLNNWIEAGEDFPALVARVSKVFS
ncbi:hypothetical protein LCGC14_2034670, partial [marine sediment metagenome]